MCMVCGCTVCSAERREKAWPRSTRILMRMGRPRPRLMSNTLEPMALETAMSPNPSRATKMELMASCTGGKGCSWCSHKLDSRLNDTEVYVCK